MCHFMNSEGKTNEDLMRLSINSQILSIIKHSYTDTLIIIAVRVSSTKKTDHYDITEILLKVTLSTINQ
jgi:hypothetical protein